MDCCTERGRKLQDPLTGKNVMKISKIINNNVVSTFDEDGREVVVMGRGVGFKAKEGMAVNEAKVEKIFRLDKIGRASCRERV